MPAHGTAMGNKNPSNPPFHLPEIVLRFGRRVSRGVILVLRHSLFANSECGMSLKSQDLLVALKLVASGDPGSFAALAASLGMSVAEVHAGVKRLESGRLIRAGTREVLRESLMNLLLHGVPHVCPQ
jgi:hypothetical protein